MKTKRQQLVSMVISNLVTLVLLSTPVSAETLLTISLAESATVSGSRFMLGDIASYDSGSSELWKMAAAEAIGTTPRKGTSITATANGILGLLSQLGYDWRKIDIVGAQVMTITRAEQSISPQTIQDFLAVRLEEELGTKVIFDPIRPLPTIKLPGGNPKLSVRFPDKPGYHLPDAVDFHINGRLAATLPLSLYLRFTLNSVIAAQPVAARTELMPMHIGMGEMTFKAGNEVVVDPAQVLGLTTRIAIPKGNPVRYSRLNMPADIVRGSEVTMLIVVDGVTLRATALALSDAFIGQRTTVKRIHDKKKYTGRVAEGPVVVIE